MSYSFSVAAPINKENIRLLDALGFFKGYWDEKLTYVALYGIVDVLFYDSAKYPSCCVISDAQLPEVAVLMKLGIAQKVIIEMQGIEK